MKLCVLYHINFFTLIIYILNSCSNYFDFSPAYPEHRLKAFIMDLKVTFGHFFN